MLLKTSIKLASVAASAAALLASPKPAIADEYELCLAGGPGASSCSYTFPGGGGCSITCRDGYYACCNGAWCKCFEDGKPPTND